MVPSTNRANIGTNQANLDIDMALGCCISFFLRAIKIRCADSCTLYPDQKNARNPRPLCRSRDVSARRQNRTDGSQLPRERPERLSRGRYRMPAAASTPVTAISAVAYAKSSRTSLRTWSGCWTNLIQDKFRGQSMHSIRFTNSGSRCNTGN